VEDLTYRFEVLLTGVDWVPYTAGALGIDDAGIDIEYPGDRHMIGIWQEPTEIARRELDKAPADLTGEVPRLAGLHGLRVLVWEGATTDGEAVVILRASAEQLALGRLRRAAAGYTTPRRWWPRHGARLRAQVIAADTVDRLARNRIATRRHRGRTIWARPLVLQFLAGTI
jgi:hypothetical protein